MTKYAPVVELSELTASQGFRINGEAEGSHSGFSVAAAGDVNGDGYADLIIGAPDDVPGGPRDGRAYVVFGAQVGFGSKVDLYALDGSNGFRMFGEAAGDRAGRSVSSAGDVNGDAFDDLIVGAYGHDPAGASYVVFGKASGFDADLQLSSLDGTNGFRIDGAGRTVSGGKDVNGDGLADVVVGDTNGDGFARVVFGSTTPFAASVSVASLDGTNGFSVKGHGLSDLYRDVSVGDVNGDHLADVMIGAVKWVEGDSDFLSDTLHYRAYVVFGSDSGFPATVKLSALDGQNGFRFDAERGHGLPFAYQIASAGDVNGDGIDDLVVGSSFAVPEGRTSACYVLYGSASGFDPVVKAAALDGSNGFKILPAAQYIESVSSAGDFNGDGYSDFLVSGSGTTAVVFGNSAGFGAVLDLASLDGNNGFLVHGATTASAAGDVNGDGYDDLILGAPSAGDASGVSTVMFGRGPAEATTVTGNANDNTIHGSNFGDDVLSGGGGRDTLLAYGGNDSLDGGTGSDSLYGGSGMDHLVGGTGNDLLWGDLDADVLEGGSGSDTFVYDRDGESCSVNFDTVVGADFESDTFLVFTSVNKIDHTIDSGQLSLASFDGDLSNALNAHGDGDAFHAVLFKPDSGDLAGKVFLFIGDSDDGYQKFQDVVICLEDTVDLSRLDTTDFQLYHH